MNDIDTLVTLDANNKRKKENTTHLRSILLAVINSNLLILHYMCCFHSIERKRKRNRHNSGRTSLFNKSFIFLFSFSFD